MRIIGSKEIHRRSFNPQGLPCRNFPSILTLAIKSRIHRSRPGVGFAARIPGYGSGAIFALVTLLICSPLFASHAYDQQLKKRVDAVWYRPNGSEGLSTTVRFGLDRNGNLTELRIVKSSGNRAFDKSLLEAFRRAAPFSPLPPAILESYSAVEFTFGSAKAAQTDQGPGSVEPLPPTKKQPIAKPSPKSDPKKESPQKDPGAPI